jgi:hypothetical protein
MIRIAGAGTGVSVYKHPSNITHTNSHGGSIYNITHNLGLANSSKIIRCKFVITTGAPNNYREVSPMNAYTSQNSEGWWSYVNGNSIDVYLHGVSGYTNGNPIEIYIYYIP